MYQLAALPSVNTLAAAQTCHAREALNTLDEWLLTGVLLIVGFAAAGVAVAAWLAALYWCENVRTRRRMRTAARSSSAAGR
jgi:hypothetical protein